MEVCRVCLAAGPDKDIYHLKTSKREGTKSPTEIIYFCLGIQLAEEDSKITKKLCTKCFKKIITYYKFKSMALRNEEAFKFIKLQCSVKLEPLDSDNECHGSQVEGFLNETQDSMALSNLKKGNEYNADVKEESNTPDYDSDDEMLSTLKCLKSENGAIDNDSIFVSIEAVTDTTKNIKELFYAENDKDNNKSKKVTPKKCKRRIHAEPKRKQQRKSRAKPRDSNGKIISNEDMKYRKGICAECGKSVKNLKEHMITHLPEHLKKTVPCNYPGCDRKFSSYSIRYKHYKRVHLRIKDHCDICNRDYTCLKTHIKQVHQKELMTHKCMLCERRFISKSALEIHVGMHTKSRPYSCEHCGQLYRSPVCLRNHIRAVHNGEKSHMCQFCDKKFFKKCHLEDHVRSHTKERPYSCKICDMKFTNSTTLKNHTDTHRATKDFHCQICSMSFTRDTYLRVHMRTHTKEKSYPCKYCGVSFGRSDHRKRHQFTAHEKHMPRVADTQSTVPHDQTRKRVKDDRETIPSSVGDEKLPPFDVNPVDSA